MTGDIIRRLGIARHLSIVRRPYPDNALCLERLMGNGVSSIRVNGWVEHALI